MNEIYEAPELEVLNVAVEAGFQSSDSMSEGDFEVPGGGN